MVGVAHARPFRFRVALRDASSAIAFWHVFWVVSGTAKAIECFLNVVLRIAIVLFVIFLVGCV